VRPLRVERSHRQPSRPFGSRQGTAAQARACPSPCRPGRKPAKLPVRVSHAQGSSVMHGKPDQPTGIQVGWALVTVGAIAPEGT